ncbi:5-DOPA dioxygenase extradiol-like [Octopus vulgaris]|uniref:5-DOPA dioxygenase extradiol-like n=1 Tax=Octopus vulgaris TaxID=6645 RepID=A0AA36BQB4_OCTVU|nr:5-DOPA dioxygenase extradiol-like [Octopus vulgaris]
MSAVPKNLRQPVLFLSHGGGPSLFMDAKQYPSTGGMDKHSDAAQFLRELTRTYLRNRPKAVLVVSAHWSEQVATVMEDKSHSLYYDYYGFPDSTYNVKWQVSGAPAVAARVLQLFKAKGISCTNIHSRGLDHGVFVPLSLIWPRANVPVLQVSLKNSLTVADHQEMGEALSELSKEGVLIIGSGFMTHTFEKMGQSHKCNIFQWASDLQKWNHRKFPDIPTYFPHPTSSDHSTIHSFCRMYKVHNFSFIDDDF